MMLTMTMHCATNNCGRVIKMSEFDYLGNYSHPMEMSSYPEWSRV